MKAGAGLTASALLSTPGIGEICTNLYMINKYLYNLEYEGRALARSR